VALLIGFFGLPRGDEPIPVIARRAVTMAIPEWHTTEAVNAIVYGTRGFDTIGESFLLVAAVVSVVLVARKKKERPGGGAEEEMARRERDGLERGGGFPEAGEHGATKEAKEAERAEEHGEDEDDHVARGGGPDPNESMTVVTRIATHALLPVLAMAALVIVSWGYSPGGGFPAAVALCGVALLVYASRGLGALGPVGNPDVLEVVEVVASLGLICVGLGGFIGSGSVTQNFLPLGVTGTIQGGGELQAMSGIEVFEVAGGILLVLVSLLTMRHDWSGEDDGGGDGGDGGGDDSGAVAADEAGVGARGEGEDEAGVGARGEGEDEAGVGAEGVPA
jgi:multicomponent Na+:H+ antiporter subunit B